MIGKWHLGHANSVNTSFLNVTGKDACLPGGTTKARGFENFFGLPFSHEEGEPGPPPASIVFPPVPLIRNGEVVEQPFV